MEEYNEKEHALDILSRQWKNDFSSLSTNEINSLLVNMFYQLFLISVDEIEINSSYDRDGSYVTFRISGEAFVDSDKNLNEEDIDNEV